MVSCRNNIEFPCTYKNGKSTTLEQCEKCKRSENCDIYEVVLDDSDN